MDINDFCKNYFKFENKLGRYKNKVNDFESWFTDMFFEKLRGKTFHTHLSDCEVSGLYLNFEDDKELCKLADKIMNDSIVNEYFQIRRLHFWFGIHLGKKECSIHFKEEGRMVSIVQQYGFIISLRKLFDKQNSLVDQKYHLEKRNTATIRQIDMISRINEITRLKEIIEVNNVEE